MKKNYLLILLSAFFFFCLTHNALALTWVYAGPNLKLESVAATPEGLVFTIKARTPVAPNSSCVNEFIVPRAHADYDMLAAFLLTASANRKKIGIVYDDDSTECQVEVQSVAVY